MAFVDFKVTELSGHSRKVYALGWNSDGECLASGSTDKCLRLWDAFAHDREALAELRGHTGSIHQLCWDPKDKSRLATTAADKSVKIWDIRDTRKAKFSVSLSEECFDVTYSNSGMYISVSNKQRVSLIDCRTWRTVSSLVLPVEVNETKFCNEKFIIVAAGHPSGYGTFEVLKSSTHGDTKHIELEHVKQVISHFGHQSCLDIDRQNRYAAFGGQDSLVSIWDLNELNCVRTLCRSAEGVRTIGFSFDGSLLAYGGFLADQPVIEIAKVNTGKCASKAVMLRTPVEFLTWNPTKNVFAYVGDKSDERNCDRDGIIKILSLQ